MIEQAKTYHLQKELLEAVGLSANEAADSKIDSMVSAAGDRLQSTTGTVGEQLREGAEQVQQGAHGLWRRMKETASNLQERSAQVFEK